jgi:hypothetical protein
VHDVFHVGLLKPYHGEPPEEPVAQPPLENGACCLYRYGF